MLIGILNTFQSCKVEEETYRRLFFKNRSDHVITIHAFWYAETDSGFANTINNEIDVFRLRQGSSYFHRIELPLGGPNEILFFADSAVVTFGDSVEASFLSRVHLHPDTIQPFNFLDDRNYIYNEKNQNYIDYVFTNDDYENAL